jgi:NitT/TauT family transport system permease protein
MLMPYVAALLRITYGVGWKIATIAELFGAETGLGVLMQRGQQASDTATVFATALAIVVIFSLGEKLLIEPLARRFRPHQE